MTSGEFFSSISKSDIAGVVVSVDGDMEKASAALLEWDQDASKHAHAETGGAPSLSLKELHNAAMSET
jgi:hypothetical protein